MLLSAVSVLVVAQSSSEVPEGLMSNPVFYGLNLTLFTGYTYKEATQTDYFVLTTPLVRTD